MFDAITQLRPYGVDSCTGTNRTDKKGDNVRFKKDPEKVRHFITEAKRADTFLLKQEPGT